jgi:iron complex transport system substrate-binding protein
MKQNILVVLCLVTLFSLFAQVMCPNTAQGVPLPKNPGRIVSLSPAITEELYLLGMEDTIVGVTSYCQKPPQARQKTKVGSVMEGDIEKIVSLRPDLVLAMSLTNARDIGKLRQLGLKVVVFDIPQDFAQLCDIFLQLGKSVGREEKALKLLVDSKKRVSDITQKVSKLTKQKVLIQIGSKPFFVATKAFFVNDYIEFAGGVNIFKDATSGSVSREEVLRKNPDVILVAAMGLSGENERSIWKRFTSIDAVRKDRIYIIDPDICSPTPVSFAESLEEIARILHPEYRKGK